MKNSFHTERFIIRVFLYFWFLIRAYLRDPLDFSWILNANIKLNYCVCKNRSNFDRYQENCPPENPLRHPHRAFPSRKLSTRKLPPMKHPLWTFPPVINPPKHLPPKKLLPLKIILHEVPPRRTYKSYKWKEK